MRPSILYDAKTDEALPIAHWTRAGNARLADGRLVYVTAHTYWIGDRQLFALSRVEREEAVRSEIEHARLARDRLVEALKTASDEDLCRTQAYVRWLLSEGFGG